MLAKVIELKKLSFIEFFITKFSKKYIINIIHFERVFLFFKSIITLLFLSQPRSLAAIANVHYTTFLKPTKKPSRLIATLTGPEAGYPPPRPHLRSAEAL